MRTRIRILAALVAAPGDMGAGAFRFYTVNPGRLLWPDGLWQVPLISVWIVARGINVGLQMRICFSDEAEANAEGPILSRLEHQMRVPTLIAQKQDDGSYRFDVYV
jgi:protocatechuate 3,4-dioxygenase alpha subunit